MITIEEYVRKSLEVLETIEREVVRYLPRSMVESERIELIKGRMPHVVAIYCATVQAAATIELGESIHHDLKE